MSFYHLNKRIMIFPILLCMIVLVSCHPQLPHGFTLEDKFEVMKLILDRALVKKQLPDYNLIKDKKNIILSDINIENMVTPIIDGVIFWVMPFKEIQERANEEGDFFYLSFSHFEYDEASITVSLDNSLAISEKVKNSPRPLIGGGMQIKYHKVDDKWIEDDEIRIWMSYIEKRSIMIYKKTDQI